MGKNESKLITNIVKIRPSKVKLPIRNSSTPALSDLAVLPELSKTDIFKANVPKSLEEAKAELKGINTTIKKIEAIESDKNVSLPKEMLQTCELILRIGSLVHQIQKERGMSAIIMGKSGTPLVQTLQLVRLQADKSLEEIIQFLKGANWNENTESQVALLSTRTLKVRASIDEQKINFRSVVKEFSELTAVLFNLIAETLQTLKAYKVGPAASTYTAFLHLKESVGVERALVGGLLSAEEDYELSSYSDLVFNAGEQRAYGKAFTATASEEAVKLYQDVCVQSNELEKIEERLEVFKMSGKPESLYKFLPDLTSSKWFELMTEKIDKLEKIEHSLANGILEYGSQVMRVSSALHLQSQDQSMEIKVGNQSFDLGMMGLTKDYLIDVRELNVVKEIGRGTTGSTYLATWRGTQVAVKVVQCSKEGKEAEMLMRDFAREIAVLTKARHPNICQFLGCSLDPPTFCVVLEFMEGGSLYDILKCKKTVEFFPLARGVARGMEYLHSHCQMNHRDLKSPNLLLDLSGKMVKIADFGLSCLDDEAGVKTAEIGTYRWMAPEVILHEPYGYPSDVYSYACVLSEVLTHQMPFAGIAPMQVALKVAEGIRPKLPSSTPEPIKNLIADCWEHKPEKRPTFKEILSRLDQIHLNLTQKESENLLLLSKTSRGR